MPTPTETLINKSVMELYRNYWAERNDAILKYWDFYLGKHADHLPRFRQETDTDYSDRKKGAIIENHCKSIVNTQIGFLYGGDVGRWIENRSTGKADEQWQEFFEERVWKRNDMKNFMIDVALMQGITGFGVITKKPDMIDGSDYRVKEKATISKKGYIKYDILDSITCMPLPRLITHDEGKTWEIEERTFAALIKIYKFDNFLGNWAISRKIAVPYEQYDYIEYIDDGHWIKWGRTRSGDYKQISAFPEQGAQENPYGSIRIPFTLFRNPGDPMKLEGESDIHDTIPLNINLNERLTDDRNTLSFSAFPIFVIKGGVMPKGFVVKPGAGLELNDPNMSAEWLTWDGNLESSLKNQESTRDNIQRVSSTSDLSRSGTETGQLRSGTGLRGKFAADILRAKMKLPLVLAAEKELIYSTMEMFSWLTGKKFNRLDYEAHVEFPDPETVIGLDKMTDVQVEKMEYDLGVKGLRDLIIKARPDIAGDEAAIEKLIKEFKEEQKQNQQQQNQSPAFKKNFEQENVQKE